MTMSIPVLMAAVVAATSKHANEKVVAGTLVASIASCQLRCRTGSALAAALGGAFLAMSSRPQNPLKRSALKVRAVLSAFSVIAVLMAENFMIWVVSATYVPSHTMPYPQPLQDNGKIVLGKINDFAQLSNKEMQALRDSFNPQWALISAALVGILGACDLKLGRAGNRNMWLLSMRALLTFSCARVVRTISFLLTVLPSQTPDCYKARFPYPVPQNWGDWILTGMKPAVGGGCNDLIVSGHAIVTSVVTCVCTSVADNTTFSLAAWSLLAFDCVVEVYQGFHYSVDMWMGVVLTCLIFNSLAIVEKAGGETEQDPEGRGVWEPRKDEMSGRIFYINHTLMQTQWHPPMPAGGAAGSDELLEGERVNLLKLSLLE